MIEKIKSPLDLKVANYKGTQFDIIPAETFAMVCRKINELVDAVNELHAEAESNARTRADHEHKIEALQKDYDNVCIWVGEQRLKTPAENVLIKTFRMDKEFAEDECVRLKGKLETTQNALEVALAALNTIKPKKDVSQGGFWTLSQSDILDVILRAEKEIKRITKDSDNE